MIQSSPAGLGDRPGVLDCLEKAHVSDSQGLGWLRNDLTFVSLRSEPRFAALPKEAELD